MPPWFVVAFVAVFCGLALSVVGGFLYLSRRAGTRRFADFLSDEPSLGAAYIKWLAQFWWLSAFIAAAAAAAVVFALAQGDRIGLLFAVLVSIGAAVQAAFLRQLHRR